MNKTMLLVILTGLLIAIVAVWFPAWRSVVLLSMVAGLIGGLVWWTRGGKR